MPVCNCLRLGGEHASYCVTRSRADDAVDHPSHYTSGPRCECGRVIECITVIRDRRLSIGNAMKYLWRNGLKLDADKSQAAKQIEDLKKARWFIDDEIAQLEAAQKENA